MDNHQFAFIVLYSFATWLLAASILNIKRSCEAKTWPVAYGKITGQEQEPLGAVRHGNGMRHQRHRPVITYEYHINGQHYQSQQCFFGDSISIPLFNALVLNRWEPGRAIRVYHHPHQPAQSVILTGMTLHHAMTLGISLALLAILLGAS